MCIHRQSSSFVYNVFCRVFFLFIFCARRRAQWKPENNARIAFDLVVELMIFFISFIRSFAQVAITIGHQYAYELLQDTRQSQTMASVSQWNKRIIILRCWKRQKATCRLKITILVYTHTHKTQRQKIYVLTQNKINIPHKYHVHTPLQIGFRVCVLCHKLWITISYLRAAKQ